MKEEFPQYINDVKMQLRSAFSKDSEMELLEILKNNSFLFFELFSRKFMPRPIFHEVSLGTKFRCDFAWLNDNSDGPEWVLVEVERPNIKLFKRDGNPHSELNKAIDQVKSWRRYFNESPAEKRNIFGAVKSFRFILIAGSKEDWENPNATKWRMDFNNTEPDIEIRSMDVFWRAIEYIQNDPHEGWSDNRKTLPFSSLKPYWQVDPYINKFRSIMD